LAPAEGGFVIPSEGAAPIPPPTPTPPEVGPAAMDAEARRGVSPCWGDRKNMIVSDMAIALTPRGVNTGTCTQYRDLMRKYCDARKAGVTLDQEQNADASYEANSGTGFDADNLRRLVDDIRQEAFMDTSCADTVAEFERDCPVSY
jgi:hypothetical protein